MFMPQKATFCHPYGEKSGLGVVLYEMITGQQPFKGDYEQAVMYSILNEQPEPITALRTGVPMELERVANKCLAKRTEERYQAAADLIVDLQAVADDSTGAATAIRAAPEPSPKRNRLWPALAAAAALLAVGVSWLHFTEPEPKRPVRKFALAPEGFQSNEARAAISPNGEYIAYSAGTPEMSLWVRPLNQESPRRLEGTEGAIRPFWSPDSEFIGFAAGGSLKRVPLSGGPAAEICRLPGIDRYFLAAWRPGGDSIVFASQNPSRLFEVSAGGGEPRLIVNRAASEEPAWASSPQFVSDRILLYRVGTAPFLGDSLVARDMETGEEQEWPVPAGAFPQAISSTNRIPASPATCGPCLSRRSLWGLQELRFILPVTPGGRASLTTLCLCIGRREHRKPCECGSSIVPGRRLTTQTVVGDSARTRCFRLTASA